MQPLRHRISLNTFDLSTDIPYAGCIRQENLNGPRNLDDDFSVGVKFFQDRHKVLFNAINGLNIHHERPGSNQGRRIALRVAVPQTLARRTASAGFSKRSESHPIERIRQDP
jgi:hypothetical protein